MNQEPIKLVDLVGPENVKKRFTTTFDTVFVLGAGFSKSAGFPLTDELGKKLKENYQYNSGKFTDQERDKLYQVLQPYRRATEENYDFETALSELYENENLEDYNLVCRSIYASLDGCATALGGNECLPYFKFLKLWRLTNSALVTFNYDTVLEATHYHIRHFLANCPEYDTFGSRKTYQDTYDLWFDYGFGAPHQYFNAWPPGTRPEFEAAPVKRPFLKLHGGMNWWLCEDDGQLAYRADHSNNTHSDRCPRCQGPVKSSIIPPTSKKNIGVFSGMWEHAAFLLNNARNIVVIGYSFPKTDEATLTLFKKALKRANPPSVTIVDFSPSEEKENRKQAWQEKFQALFEFQLDQEKIHLDGMDVFVTRQI